MPNTTHRRNRFLLPLALVGVLFCLTAWLSALMMLRAEPATAAAPSALTVLIRDWGLVLLVSELLVLAVCALGSILTERQR